MKIFVSHSFDDGAFLSHLKESLNFKQNNKFELLIASEKYDPINTVSNKITKFIDRSDICLVMLTEKGINSNFVQQEIGYITKTKKPSILLVQKGLENKITGFISDKDYIIYDPERPEDCINKIMKTFNKFENEMSSEESKAGILFALGALAIGVILAGVNSDSNNKKVRKK